MSAPSTPGAAAPVRITVDRDAFARAFEEWAKRTRVNPSRFLTPEECDALECSRLAAQSADYFWALLKAQEGEA